MSKPCPATRKLLRIISTNPESIPEEMGRKMNSGPAQAGLGTEDKDSFLLPNPDAIPSLDMELASKTTVATAEGSRRQGGTSGMSSQGSRELILCFTLLFLVNFIPNHSLLTFTLPILSPSHHWGGREAWWPFGVKSQNFGSAQPTFYVEFYVIQIS